MGHGTTGLESVIVYRLRVGCLKLGGLKVQRNLGKVAFYGLKVW